MHRSTLEGKVAWISCVTYFKTSSINHILHRLDLTTWAHINLVSKSWRALSLLAPCRPQIPWLWLLPLTRSHQNLLLGPPCCTVPEFSPQLLDISIPSTSIASHGRFVMLNIFSLSSLFSTSLFLYNPFNGQTFKLPSIIRSHDGHILGPLESSVRIPAF